MNRIAIAAILAVFAITTGGAAFAEDNTLTDAERKDGWLLLWDGKTYDGWMSSRMRPSKRPLDDDGLLKPYRIGGYLLVHEELWGDFILSLDFKLTEGANSGVFLRTNPLDPRKDNTIWQNAIEVQVYDNPTADMHDTGAFYDLKPPTKNALKPLGEWNRMVIECNGPLMKVNLNGEDVNEIDLSAYTEPYRRADGSEHKFPVAFRDHPAEGYIGLQDHGDEVFYKNIKLKPLGK